MKSLLFLTNHHRSTEKLQKQLLPSSDRREIEQRQSSCHQTKKKKALANS